MMMAIHYWMHTIISGGRETQQKKKKRSMYYTPKVTRLPLPFFIIIRNPIITRSPADQRAVSPQEFIHPRPFYPDLIPTSPHHTISRRRPRRRPRRRQQHRTRHPTRQPPINTPIKPPRLLQTIPQTALFATIQRLHNPTVPEIVLIPGPRRRRGTPIRGVEFAVVIRIQAGVLVPEIHFVGWCDEDFDEGAGGVGGCVFG